MDLIEIITDIFKKKQKKAEKEEQDRLLELRKNVVRVDTEGERGLTQAQVDERINAHWVNEVVDSSTKTVKEIIISNSITYFNLIFLALGILLICVGSFRNITFLPVIFANTLIGIVQELRAKAVLDKMNMLNTPHSMVVRDGKEIVIDSKDLVIDDVVIFQAGNQICADAVIVSGNIQANESLLTGEPDDIEKKLGDELMSGSFVVSGKCYARLTNIGKDSYISKLSIEAKTMEGVEQSEMIRALNKLLKVIGILIIPMSILLMYQGMKINCESFTDSVTAMVAAIIGMIPEGLYLLTSVALALSTIRLATQKVLLHDMKSIETLARVNVLCVDKTGTITNNEMSVENVIPASDFEGYDTMERMLGDFVNAMSDDNITMSALKKYFTENTGKNAVNRTSFSSALKYSSVTYDDGVYVLGAPEMVLRDAYPAYVSQIEEYSKEGGRVLVFASYNGKIDGKPLTEQAKCVGFVVLSNKIRENAVDTFRYFAEQGVDIKVISGDNPVTVSNVAAKAGIANAEKYIDASTLTTYEQLYEAVKEYTVFGRVTPEQKRQFVGALKKQGNTVAMTGDGVNDVLALKDADCSIAMASGSEAASQVAQVVLLESDFSRMPSVVLEGRRVVNNIERSASLFLVKNIFSLLLALMSIFAAMTYPLEPAQVSLIAMFTIGIPGFFLALEPNKNRIKGNFMTNVLTKALPAGITDALCVGALVTFGQTFGLEEEGVATAATLLLAIVGFMIMYKISRPLNRLSTSVLAGCILGLIIASTLFSDLFYMSSMSGETIMLAVVFAFACESIFRILTFAVEKIKRFVSSDIEE